MGWTESGSSGDAFLVLDRNNNGTIENGTELFGNITPQPPSETPNGFLALAVFDTGENGGNGDSLIDEKDAVFSRLRLWVDRNHDGISQQDEMHNLPELGVLSLSLLYRESSRDDQFGNIYRYRAMVNPHLHKQDSKIGRWAYDVYFLKARTTSSVETDMTRSRCGTSRSIASEFPSIEGSDSSASSTETEATRRLQ